MVVEKLIKGKLIKTVSEGKKMASGGSTRAAFMLYPLPSVANPTGPDRPGSWILLHSPDRWKKEFPPPLATAQPIRDGRNLANEKPLYFELLVYANDLFVYNSLFNSRLCSIREGSSP